jgi:hypothetical protein
MKYRVGDEFIVKNVKGLDGLRITIVSIEDNTYTIHYSDDRPSKNYEGYTDNWFDLYGVLDEVSEVKRILKEYDTTL